MVIFTFKMVAVHQLGFKKMKFQLYTRTFLTCTLILSCFISCALSV